LPYIGLFTRENLSDKDIANPVSRESGPRDGMPEDKESFSRKKEGMKPTNIEKEGVKTRSKFESDLILRKVHFSIYEAIEKL
jgi:hypothetical protein